MVVLFVVPEVFLDGGPGQTGDGCPRVLEYRYVDPTNLKQDFVPIFSCGSHIQEKVFIDAIESEQMDITKLQIFPGA